MVLVWHHIRARCAGTLQQTLAAVAVGRVSIKDADVSIKGHVLGSKGHNNINYTVRHFRSVLAACIPKGFINIPQ